MNSSKRICIFVDGENLRHSIGKLFPNFNRQDYLPETDWTKFFDWIATQVTGSTDAERVRTYWYAVQNIDFAPPYLNTASKTEENSRDLLMKNKERAEALNKITDAEAQRAMMRKMINELLELQDVVQKRFMGWTRIQDDIARRSIAIEFRRAGYIRFDLFDRQFGSEKAVDMKLGVDLFKLKDIYDIAVIVSGDQDYVPAVDSIKDFGKHVINVAFLTEDNKLLPGGAKRLSQSTDRGIELKYGDLKTHLRL